MRKRILKLTLPMLVLAAGLGGLLSPRQADAARQVCSYFCIDPELTCCFTCYWVGGSCVCPESCLDEG